MEAIRVFIWASSGYVARLLRSCIVTLVHLLTRIYSCTYLEEFVEVGGASTLLEILTMERSTEVLSQFLRQALTGSC